MIQAIRKSLQDNLLVVTYFSHFNFRTSLYLYHHISPYYHHHHHVTIMRFPFWGLVTTTVMHITPLATIMSMSTTQVQLELFSTFNISYSHHLWSSQSVWASLSRSYLILDISYIYIGDYIPHAREYLIYLIHQWLYPACPCKRMMQPMECQLTPPLPTLPLGLASSHFQEISTRFYSFRFLTYRSNFHFCFMKWVFLITGCGVRSWLCWTLPPPLWSFWSFWLLRKLLPQKASHKYKTDI